MNWRNLVNLIQPAGMVKNMEGQESRAGQAPWVQQLSAKRWTIALLVMAFLLGKAQILGELAPFSAAFFAVVYFVRKDLAHWAGAVLVAGSFFERPSHTGSILMEMAVFYLLQKALEKYERSEIAFAPLLVFISAFSVHLFTLLIQIQMTWFSLLMTAVEALLSFVLTLIFLQAIPVFITHQKRAALKNEQIICLIILLASVMTGMVGWSVQGISVEHVVSRYLILLFALAGGAPLGASVGVITGLILSLADVSAVTQMSLLAFSGMLAGLLKEGHKSVVGLGFLIGSSILSVYVGNQSDVLMSSVESALAVVLFLLTPKLIVAAIAQYVPGTQEHGKLQRDYAKRVRDVTAGRVEQFSEIFRQLSTSFKQFAHEGQALQKDQEVAHFMDAVAEKRCATCWKRGACWDEHFYETYQYLTELMTKVEENPQLDRQDIPLEWKRYCIKSDRVLDLMKDQYDIHKNDLHWKKQILESRHLVAEQLSGVSRVMDDLAREIKREGQELYVQEEQIRSALEQLGLSIYAIDIVSLDEGNVEIEVVHQYPQGFDECRKIIAPLLSDILEEPIVVKSEQPSSQSEGYHTVIFGSAKDYEVDTGIAGAAKGGDLLSGDSFSTMELGNGKFAVAISDGMGNGERARAESSTALTILQQLLQSGMDEKLAIKSVNSVLMLRSSDEVFATIDVALIDLNTAKTTFLKIGSTPSFIKRGNEVLRISANNLPVGILQDIDVDLVGVQLKPGDTLIMMTDGVYDAPGPAVNKDLWMKRLIQEIEADTPQEVADCLLESVVRYHQGEIADDMTVVVARVDKYRPEWKAIRWQGLTRLERPKTVS